MDVVTTSLEALIQRATNPQNQKPDIAAIEAFCAVLTKEVDGPQIGSKLLACHIQSPTESEALQALNLLDTCMKQCGSQFHAEVGKFRFLNEMIRLVSPKYLGNRTPNAVRQKVLQLLYSWTKQYPRESKIKEAYEMLKKQGVIEDDSPPIITNADEILKPSKAKNTIFEDEEKSKLLQKLLQSKNPDDLQAANRLIKTMVKEDERRVQLNSRRIMELESVHNNVKLLSEMLDSYNRHETSAEDLELMRHIYQACERLRPVVLRLANETQDNEEMLSDVLVANDELGQVFEKYTSVIVLGQAVERTKVNENNTPSLLDLSSPTEIDSSISTDTNNVSNPQTDMEALGDIFSSLHKTVEPSPVSDANILLPDSTIMQPISVLPTNNKSENTNVPAKKIDGKAKALEELNELGESLLKQSLSCTKGRLSNGSKLPINKMTKDQSMLEYYNASTLSNVSGSSSQFDATSISSASSKKEAHDIESVWKATNLVNGDNALIDITQSSSEDVDPITGINNAKSENTPTENAAKPVNETTASTNSEPEIKSLADIHVNLQDIKPGTNPPMTVIEEKNGISVVLHFVKDSPREDVTVIVVTTMSKNEKPLSDYLFQAVVPKRCKCRLQPPSGTDLPAHNPFLPPSAITQIMLIANPHKELVSLKFMLSYTMDDETITEMGEVDRLPHL